MPKASLGIAIIARNSAKTIGDCLDSIVPYVEQVVVAVDRDTTDNTAEVARAHGAEVHEGLVVSEVHECPQHGRVMAQHFAKARQKSFAYLRQDLDFWGWVDADDHLKGGEKLAECLTRLPSEVAGVWLPYHYATAGEGGPTTTIFDRERIVRSNMPWAWQFRVHEILTPVGCTTESLNWTRTDDISVWHQGEGHDTAGSARRNILLLELDLEEDPNDMRAWFYMGNQYFALGEWAAAVHYYERSTEAQNAYQLWQSLIYLSMAYEKLGDLNASRSAAFRALDIQPQHPEPYYRLASAYMMAGEMERTEFWTHLGDQMPDPPFFVFRNPLDRLYNARLTLATAYANAGRTSKARQELERAASAFPAKDILDGIAFHKKMEVESQLADAYVSVLATQTTNTLAHNIPVEIWKFGRVRDIVVPNIIAKRSSTQPRLLLWCGRSVEPWAPPSIDSTGIGGSETAVIQIAKRFAADGWRVDVYNDCNHYEGEYEQVGYWDCNRLQANEQTDLFISWRNPAAYQLPVQRRMSLLWAHDLHQGPSQRDAYRQWDKVLGVSQWHADYLSQLYDLPNTGYVPNGIDLDRFTKPTKKVPFRCVYTSSPDRGLEQLLQMWPQIVANEPGAELQIAYGWDTIDKYIQMGHQPLIAFKAHMQQLIEKTPKVTWLGRLPQDKLAELYSSAYAMVYPSSFLEVNCIVVQEAMAAGCAVVASGVGALPETIGDGGLVVKGNIYTKAWRDFYVQVLKGVLHAPEVRKRYEKAGKERAKDLTWDRSYTRWQEIVTPLLEGKKEEVLVV